MNRDDTAKGLAGNSRNKTKITVRYVVREHKRLKQGRKK